MLGNDNNFQDETVRKKILVLIISSTSGIKYPFPFTVKRNNKHAKKQRSPV